MTAVKRRIEEEKVVIPLILPTCEVAEVASSMPPFLDTFQRLDLGRDEHGPDPFGRLLNVADGRNADGHYRPSIVVLRNSNEPSTKVAESQVVSNCRNQLHRVTVLDYADINLEEKLRKACEKADVLVSLLASDAFRKLPGELFCEGIARGASKIAEDSGLYCIEWRGDDMKFPVDSDEALSFRNSKILKNLPSDLTRHVSDEAKKSFSVPQVEHSPHSESEQSDTDGAAIRSLFGYPLNDVGKRFLHEITEHLEASLIGCDPLPKWELVYEELSEATDERRALVVVITGDENWLCEVCVALKNLKKKFGDAWPLPGAFLHRADNRLDSDPIPYRPRGFPQFFGLRQLPQLESWLLQSGGTQ